MALRVNIGCGSVFHPDWVNLDIVPVHPSVRRWDARGPLPFEAGTVDAVYSSHVLEHLTPDDARLLLRDIKRVLKPGGVVRLVLPDLEEQARTYLAAIDRLDAGVDAARADHAWMVMEIVDQLVRHESGGELLKHLAKGSVENAEFVIGRMGLEGEYLLGRRPASVEYEAPRPALSRILLRLREEVLLVVARLLLGKDGHGAVREGLFRHKGQVHRWMYDRISLGAVMTSVGFQSLRCCDPQSSGIADFGRFELDVCGGQVRKPGSLFMEGAKPPISG